MQLRPTIFAAVGPSAFCLCLRQGAKALLERFHENHVPAKAGM
jgi:hypothetical protein